VDATAGRCPFCAIAADPGRARTVYADEHAVAFFPLSPATRGHTLVVPRTHSADLWAMDGAAAERLTHTVLTVGRALRELLEPDGLNAVSSAGTEASQTVFHTHVHLVPRWRGDAMGPIWPRPGEGYGDGAELDVLARRLAARLAGPPGA
jgi:histidine triad (HIT) family protein